MLTKLTRSQLALRTTWTTALRSGKYQQARRRLRDDGGFCCLGVLCDVSKKGKWAARGSYFAEPESDYAMPPFSVTSAAAAEGISGDLATMNDAHGDDFATIADAILDRLMQKHHRFTLTGESLRQKPKTKNEASKPDPS